MGQQMASENHIPADQEPFLSGHSVGLHVSQGGHDLEADFSRADRNAARSTCGDAGVTPGAETVMRNCMADVLYGDAMGSRGYHGAQSRLERPGSNNTAGDSFTYDDT